MTSSTKAAVIESLKKALFAANPHLRPVDNDPLGSAAKNIRIELKRAFQGVKFSVKTSRFSMGNSIVASWTDGPTEEQVDQILCRYAGGEFDGMEDIFRYKSSAWHSAFGEGKYVRGSRVYSDEAVAQAISRLAERYAKQFASSGKPIPTVADFKQGRLISENIFEGGPGSMNLQHLIRKSMHEHSFSENLTPKVEESEA